MTSFANIRARAELRKGGEDALLALLPKVPPREALRSLTDDRVLAFMTKRVFSAGFVWAVIEAKWPGFEAAFLGFEPGALLFQPEEFWDGLTRDTRIVRNAAKILSVRENAGFVMEVAREHGSFGQFLFDWPADDEVGLLEVLKKRGDRLGGYSGQMLLRNLGWDAWMTSTDVVACLVDAGVEIGPEAKSKRDMLSIQTQMNAWQAESGLPYTHISRICSYSIGVNRGVEELHGLED